MIDRELSQVPKYPMQELNNNGVMYVFPNLLGDAKSSMVLKDPESKTSNRDHDLVVCWDDGRPFEGRQFDKRLKS